MFIRHQATPCVAALSDEFFAAFLDTWSHHSLPAACCFAFGA